MLPYTRNQRELQKRMRYDFIIQMEYMFQPHISQLLKDAGETQISIPVDGYNSGLSPIIGIIIIGIIIIGIIIIMVLEISSLYY